MFSLADELGFNCYWGVKSYVVLDWSTFISGGTVLNNILYNAGFMFTDIVIILTTSDTMVTNYSYFLAAYLGDFFMRFFYYDPTQF